MVMLKFAQMQFSKPIFSTTRALHCSRLIIAGTVLDYKKNKLQNEGEV